MKIGLDLRWRIDGEDVDARMLPLLQAIVNTGSLSRAIRDVGLSYRHAWGLLGNLESALGRQLVKLERGRGAQLTPLGERLLTGAAHIEGTAQTTTASDEHPIEPRTCGVARGKQIARGAAGKP